MAYVIRVLVGWLFIGDTNGYYAYVNAHLTDNSNTAWVRILRVLCSCSYFSSLR